LDYNS